MVRHPSSRRVAVVLVTVLAVAGLAVVGGALGGASSADGGASPADGWSATSVDATEAPDSADDRSPAERLECTNGTSPAVVACGYHPGQSAVSLDAHQTDGKTVTVEAVDLREGGFVAVHAVSYVDGKFTESVLGVSGHLSPGLHRDVEVELDRPLGRTGEVQLVAVAYRDTDDDRRFDFAATDGSDDRPYTITYTEAGGNVTDEAGDVVGDAGTVTVTPPDVARFDTDGNGDVDADEAMAAIMAFNRGERVNGERVTAREVLAVIVAFNSGGGAP